MRHCWLSNVQNCLPKRHLLQVESQVQQVWQVQVAWLAVSLAVCIVVAIEPLVDAQVRHLVATQAKLPDAVVPNAVLQLEQPVFDVVFLLPRLPCVVVRLECLVDLKFVDELELRHVDVLVDQPFVVAVSLNSVERLRPVESRPAVDSVVFEPQSLAVRFCPLERMCLLKSVAVRLVWGHGMILGQP